MAAQKKDLEKIVGKGNVLDDEAALKKYSCDQSFVQARRPDFVVFVEKVEQIQDIVRLANKTLTPVVPYSSGLNLHGAAIADQGGIILNMSRMNNIIEIDEENMFAIVEPGVTFRQLQDVLTEKGFRVMVPLGIVPERSVLTSYLERDPVLAAPSFEDGNSLIMDTELVLPDGELFRTGNWTSGGRPGSPNGPIRNTVFRMWTAAQGTFGILTKMGVQISYIPKITKIFFIPFKSLADAVEPLRRIQRKEIGAECFLLNRFNLAAMMTESWPVPSSFPASPAASPEFAAVQQMLPPWTVCIAINALARRAEEKIAYEVEALREACDMLNVQLLESLPNIPGAESIIAAELLRPWKILKKFNYKGAVHDLTFKAPLNKIVRLEQVFEGLAREHDYPVTEAGMYLLPLERGRAMHVEIDLHCSAAAGSEQSRVKDLWLKASAALINEGAYFDRPYGPWAPLMYARASKYTHVLKQLKSEIDPNNILNPGKLCFA